MRNGPPHVDGYAHTSRFSSSTAPYFASQENVRYPSGFATQTPTNAMQLFTKPPFSHAYPMVHAFFTPFSLRLYTRNLPRLRIASSALDLNSPNFRLSIDLAIFFTLGWISSRCL